MPKKPKKRSKKTAQKTTERGEQHSIWKGYITFGLVNIPVILYSAEKPHEEVHFKLLDKNKLSAIKYTRVNEETGEEVPWEDIVKGFEYEPGNYVVLTQKDFESIAVKNLKTIEIVEFVNLNEIESVYFEKPYYTIPSQHGEKGYVLLRETLKHTGKIGIAKIIIRSHEYLAALIPSGNAIVINTLRYPQELKKPSELNLPDEKATSCKISKKEFDIAMKLVEAMSVKWDPKRQFNEYKQELIKLIEDKLAHGGKTVAKHPDSPDIKQTNVIDFMALLKKSVEQKSKPAKSVTQRKRSITQAPKRKGHPKNPKKK